MTFLENLLSEYIVAHPQVISSYAVDSTPKTLLFFSVFLEKSQNPTANDSHEWSTQSCTEGHLQVLMVNRQFGTKVGDFNRRGNGRAEH